MTRRTDTGYGIKRTAMHVADTCVANAKLYAHVVDNVLDTQPVNVDLLRMVNELSRNNMAVFEVQEKIADGKFSEAELLAEGLNVPPQKGQQKGTQKAVKSNPKTGAASS